MKRREERGGKEKICGRGWMRRRRWMDVKLIVKQRGQGRRRMRREQVPGGDWHPKWRRTNGGTVATPIPSLRFRCEGSVAAEITRKAQKRGHIRTADGPSV